MIQLVLYEPEIAANVGALLRLSACWGISLDLIGPLSFLWSDRHLKRAAMDYLPQACYNLHDSWEDYGKTHRKNRKIFLVPHAACSYTDFEFQAQDALVIGSESCGFPPELEREAHHLVKIPMVPSQRSLNMAMAAAIVTAEALRQTHQFP